MSLLDISGEINLQFMQRFAPMLSGVGPSLLGAFATGKEGGNAQAAIARLRGVDTFKHK
jgi:hypothetical protein